MKFSQLRRDLVSGDWIVISSSRSKRPDAFLKHEKRKAAPIRGCPFENPQMLNHAEPILQFNDRKGWTLQIIENRFPAFAHRDICAISSTHGPYSVTDGVGHHDLVITRDHDKDLPALSKDLAMEVFKAFQDRYLMLLHDKCLAYISMFHNWGPKAGASVYHPHYQMIAIPVIPPDFMHSLVGSREYLKKYKTCVHCGMIAWEKREKKRIIFEDAHVIAVTPFVSRSAFEIRVFPKKHAPFFENTGERDMFSIVSALQESLRMVKRSLHDPDYNFFIHTAPMENKARYANYHWHIEVLPKIAAYAGFELGTGIEINSVDPDDAARILRSS